jgi:hypothetical protein
MPATIASSARPAAAFEMSACLAMWSINSVLFTYAPPYLTIASLRVARRTAYCICSRVLLFAARAENVVEDLNDYSTATVYECQGEAKELTGSERISCRRAAKRAGFPDFVNV